MNSQIHKYWNNLQGLNILISGTLLAFGLYLYLMYRPNNPYVIKSKAIFDISDKMFTTSHWIIYNLPDALWCGSGAILINALKKKQIFTLRELMWSSSVLVCGLTIELLQIFGIVNGTFDLFDILSLFLGYLLALLILIFYL